MPLSPEEKAAGRAFRDEMQVALLRSHTADPPDHVVPNFIALYRHACPRRQGRSTALELKERYIPSPPYPDHGVPAGRFAFIYREGVCRGCGQTARSKAGRLTLAEERPPLHGRVARS
jgi:hypothetical protein